MHPLQKHTGFVFSHAVGVAFFKFNACVCVCLSLCVLPDWQASQQGRAGVRRVLEVCDVTGEILVRPHLHT